MTIVTFLPPIAEQTGRADNATVEKVALPSYSGRAGVKSNERIELRTLWLSKNWIHRIGRHVFCTFVLFSSLQKENFPPTTERSRGGYFSGPLGRVMLLRRIEWNTVHYRTGRMSLLFFFSSSSTWRCGSFKEKTDTWFAVIRGSFLYVLMCLWVVRIGYRLLAACDTGQFWLTVMVGIPAFLEQSLIKRQKVASCRDLISSHFALRVRQKQG